MLKITVAIFLLIALILSTHSQSILYSDLYKDIRPSVVVVLANNSQNTSLCQGTGFFIDKAGDIITNLHIINGSSNANVITADGHICQVKNILAKDIDSDLVCLSVDIPSQLVYPITVNTTLPEIGDDIFVVGYPEGPGKRVQSMTRGIISSIQTLPEYGEVIQIDAAISPGASGSPLVNMKSEVIGVATFGYIKGQKQNFAVSCKQVSKLIRDPSLAQGGKPISKWNLTSAESLYATGLDLYRRGEYNQSSYYFEKAILLSKGSSNISISNNSSNSISNSDIIISSIHVSNSSSNSISDSYISSSSIYISNDSINSISNSNVSGSSFSIGGYSY